LIKALLGVRCGGDGGAPNPQLGVRTKCRARVSSRPWQLRSKVRELSATSLRQKRSHGLGQPGCYSRGLRGGLFHGCAQAHPLTLDGMEREPGTTGKNRYGREIFDPHGDGPPSASEDNCVGRDLVPAWQNPGIEDRGRRGWRGQRSMAHYAENSSNREHTCPSTTLEDETVARRSLTAQIADSQRSFLRPAV
jgi:hypothetical protein